MFLCIQVNNTDNHELKSKEKVSFHLLHSYLWRLENLNEINLIEANTGAVQVCKNEFEKKPTLLNQYDALKESLLELEVFDKSASIKEELLIGIEDTETHELIKGFVRKFKNVSLKEKRKAVALFSINHPQLDQYENGNHRDGPPELVRVLFERLVCVVSMDFNISSIELNNKEMVEVKSIIKKMVDLGYSNSGVNELMHTSVDNKDFLQAISEKQGEKIASAIMDSQVQILPELESALIDNQLIKACFLMSQADFVAAGVH